MKITAVEREVRKTVAEKNESHNKGGSSENSKLGENIEHIGESELDENIAYIEESKLGEILEYIEESMNGVEENAYSVDGEGLVQDLVDITTIQDQSDESVEIDNSSSQLEDSDKSRDKSDQQKTESNDKDHSSKNDRPICWFYNRGRCLYSKEEVKETIKPKQEIRHRGIRKAMKMGIIWKGPAESMTVKGNLIRRKITIEVGEGVERKIAKEIEGEAELVTRR